MSSLRHAARNNRFQLVGFEPARLPQFPLARRFHNYPRLHRSTMDASVDAILEDIGFGPWQILCATAVCLFQASSAVQYVNTVFVNKPNVTACYNHKHVNRSLENPGYNFNNTPIIKNTVNELNISSLEEYHDECKSMSPYLASYFYESTFSNEFNLVDDRAWLSPLYQMTFVLGVILGNTVSGVSDILGRLVIIRWGAVGYIISTILVSVTPQIHVVLISRFIIGFTHEFFQTPALTLLMEITPVQYRSSLGIIVFLPYCIAGVLLGGLAYFIRPWRTLHIVSSIPVFLLTICVLFLTKSPRWLMTQGQFQEAANIFEKAAKLNKGKLPPREELISLMSNIHESGDSTEHPMETQTRSKIEQAKAFFFQFFLTPHMLKVSLITPFLWLVVGLVYYGITLNANNFTSNSYLYISLVHALEIVPTVGGSIFINKLGNILSSTILSASAGICLLGLLVLPEEVWWLKWTLVMTAFMASGYSFVLCFVMANELYPTVVRSTGSSFCSLTSNVGTLLASYLFEIVVHQVWWVPNCVCVVFCLMATIFVRFLPETNGQPLCETVQHVEERGNKKCIQKHSSKTNGKRVCESTDC